MTIPGLSLSPIVERSRSVFVDLMVFALVIASIFGVLTIGRYWLGAATPAAEISSSPAALPLYAFYSLVRMMLAYLLSLVFAIGYGYVAAYTPRLETVMIALLDILQSIPVLSFLPGVMLAMVALFPTRQLGLELGSIVLIFTGQVWNMAFSFYSSLRSIPRELSEASNIYRFSPWQRFVELELPAGTIGLVWNSIVSVASGWFFLMACEMFQLGNRDFRLPGLGSFLQNAASNDDTAGVIWGLAAMIAVIVMLDQLLWRPLIAWSDRFKFEQVESSGGVESPLVRLLRGSRLTRWVEIHAIRPLFKRLMDFAERPRERSKPKRAPAWTVPVVGALLIGAALYALFQAAVALKGVNGAELVSTLLAAGATFLRVTAALVIASAWTIPAGVAIGFNRRLARLAQPLAQVAASVPATALFPVVLLLLVQIRGGLSVGAVVLMLLGTQWYILFNVIAGAMAIPTELREASAVFRFRRWQRWKTVILPGIFPYLVTGLVTASGGAWNASIVAEYVHFRKQTLATTGLGAQITHASETGNFSVLLLSTIVMATLVVCINRTVWRPMYRLAETRYRLEG
jgi:NitT/TauT family transport system permease protein